MTHLSAKAANYTYESFLTEKQSKAAQLLARTLAEHLNSGGVEPQWGSSNNFLDFLAFCQSHNIYLVYHDRLRGMGNIPYPRKPNGS
jgi:hypothetical protein